MTSAISLGFRAAVGPTEVCTSHERKVWGLMMQLADRRQELKALEKELETEALKKANIGPGSVIRNKYTGAAYRVIGMHAGTLYSSPDRIYLSIHAVRIYKSGRPEARSSSYISADNMEVLSDEKKKEYLPDA